MISCVRGERSGKHAISESEESDPGRRFKFKIRNGRGGEHDDRCEFERIDRSLLQGIPTILTSASRR
jgi:hypothetical protein